MESVVAFTDTYLPTVNGVTYTIQTWRDRWLARGGRMDVVFPRADGYVPDADEFPVRSLPFPFYEGFRLGVPRIPGGVDGAEVVHAHTPFALGLSGMRFARKRDLPLVASYHTPTSEYTEYLTSRDRIGHRIERASERYERWFFGRADAVIAPSDRTRHHLEDTVGVDAEVIVVSNGVDTDFFRPGGGDAFREEHGLGDGPLVGYTGRHGYEKCLSDVLQAAKGLDGVTVVFGGDGPARGYLEDQAESLGVDARFLGFLDREELPRFYSALDAFAFPSPVETQGLVALEANACGTPVVAVRSGALEDTIDDGVTGYHYERGDVNDFRDAVRRALADADRLAANCVETRDAVSVEHSVDELAAVYGRVA